jgi:ATP-dependent Clp protease adaptor protein ClpS
VEPIGGLHVSDEKAREIDGRGSAAAQKSPPRADLLPPYRVLLHNDDVSEMLEVVETIVELTPLNARRASTVMLEAHMAGVALVLVTHKERAELYVEQFASKGLIVTIEPA